MAYKDILPTTNLTVSDVRDTLGESTNDIGRLCKSTKINKWAKYKPVEGEWPHGGGNYDSIGYSIPYTTVWIGNSIAELSKQWVYKPSTTKFRLGDFRGYAHTSPTPTAIELPLEANKNKIFSVEYSDYSIYLDVFEKFIADNAAVKPCLGLYVFNKANVAQYIVVSALLGDDLWFSFTNTTFAVGATLGVLLFLTDRVIPFTVSPTQPVMGLCMSARPLASVSYKEYELIRPFVPRVEVIPTNLNAIVEAIDILKVSTVSFKVTAPSAGGYIGGAYSYAVFVEENYIGDISGSVTVGNSVTNTFNAPSPIRVVLRDPLNFDVSVVGQAVVSIPKSYKIQGSNIVEV